MYFCWPINSSSLVLESSAGAGAGAGARFGAAVIATDTGTGTGTGAGWCWTDTDGAGGDPPATCDLDGCPPEFPITSRLFQTFGNLKNADPASTTNPKSLGQGQHPDPLSDKTDEQLYNKIWGPEGLFLHFLHFFEKQG